MRANLKEINKERGKDFLYHSSYDFQDNRYGYYKYDKKTNDYYFIECGQAVRVVKVLTDLATCEKLLILNFYDCSGQCIEVPFNRSEMTEQGILSLVKYGVQVNKATASVLLKCLENDEAKAPVQFHYDKTGFGLFEGNTIFKGYVPIGIDGKYSGGLKIEPKGSEEDWISMVKNEVIGTPMEVILAGALSAVMIDYVIADYPVENLIMSLVGDSTTGKTTALNLAVSAGASPSFSENSLMLSFVDTSLSIVHKISSAHPVGIDEASVLSKGLSKILYTMANGKERSRMKKDLSMPDPVDFHTAIFMSSERSVLSMSDNTSGLRVRVMEFTNVNWTTSATSSDCIKTTCLSNYGWAIPRLAEYLIGRERGFVIKRCEDWTDKFKMKRNSGACNALFDRMSKMVGIVLATAELAEDALDIKFNIELIMDFFASKLMVDPGEYDIGIQAYDAIIDYMTENPREFGEAVSHDPAINQVRYRNGCIVSSDAFELYDGSVSRDILCIKKETFSRILKKNNFVDDAVILRKLKERGLLVTPKDRKISQFKLGVTGVEEVVAKGYKIRLRSEEKAEGNFEEFKEIYIDDTEVFDFDIEEEQEYVSK